MTSLAITIRTVDSVPSWPAPGARGQKTGSTHFRTPQTSAKCVRRVESRLIHFPPADRGGREHSIPSAGARRGEKSDATRVVSTFGA